MIILFLYLSVRVIIFSIIWMLTMGKHHFWIFPNLTEDCGVIESFKPFIKHDVYDSTKELKEKAKKKRREREEEEDNDSENEEDKNNDFEMVDSQEGQEDNEEYNDENNEFNDENNELNGENNEDNEEDNDYNDEDFEDNQTNEESDDIEGDERKKDK